MTASSNRIGVDTGWLVCLAIAEHPGHESTKKQLELFRTQDARLVLAPLVLSEFVHVVSDSRRFLQPVSMDDAISFAETWWSARSCRARLFDRCQPSPCKAVDA